jgi:hypothetical protein
MENVKVGLPDSSDLLKDPEALRKRADIDGFLFFRNLLPRDAVMQLRMQFLEICKRYNYVLPGTDLSEGRVNPPAVERLFESGDPIRGIGAGKEAYADAQRLEAFHSMPHAPQLTGVFEVLFDAEVFPHPRNIARIMLPREEQTPTPAHQDFIHIQGTEEVWTAWMPVGDCPRELGGLSILPGSHKDGTLPVKAAEGAGGLEVYLCGTDYVWYEHDYAAGDVLTFHSHTVHKALPNMRRDTIRFSCDFRYQPAHLEIEKKSLRPHYDILSWEEIYKDWKEDTFKFYWKSKDLKMGRWDEAIRWQKEDIC